MHRKAITFAVAMAAALATSPALAAHDGGLVSPETDGQATPSRDSSEAQASGVPLRAVTATWYGPGLYGNQTACGRRLTPRTKGIAHLTLPCRSRVRIAYRGRSVVTRVIDRGPYGGSATIDIAAGTARQLDFHSTDRVRFAAL